MAVQEERHPGTDHSTRNRATDKAPKRIVPPGPWQIDMERARPYTTKDPTPSLQTDSDARQRLASEALCAIAPTNCPVTSSCPSEERETGKDAANADALPADAAGEDDPSEESQSAELKVALSAMPGTGVVVETDKCCLEAAQKFEKTSSATPDVAAPPAEQPEAPSGPAANASTAESSSVGGAITVHRDSEVTVTRSFDPPVRPLPERQRVLYNKPLSQMPTQRSRWPLPANTGGASYASNLKALNLEPMRAKKNGGGELGASYASNLKALNLEPMRANEKNGGGELDAARRSPTEISTSAVEAASHPSQKFVVAALAAAASEKGSHQNFLDRFMHPSAHRVVDDVGDFVTDFPADLAQRVHNFLSITTPKLCASAVFAEDWSEETRRGVEEHFERLVLTRLHNGRKATLRTRPSSDMRRACSLIRHR